jgi:hypothetical protein
MYFRKSAVSLVIGTVGIMTVMTANAATLNNGDSLSIATGIYSLDEYGDPINIASGSWYTWNNVDTFSIHSYAKSALSQGTTGIVIGQATSPGASHPGFPVGSDTNDIDAPFDFLATTGSHYTVTGITGSTTTGLDMSGWHLAYNGGSGVNFGYMGSGAWTPTNAAANGMATSGYADGIGIFNWDGVYGHTYTLDYTTTVPVDDMSGLGTTGFAFHLTGVVTAAVPEASTYCMMLVGLGLVGLQLRRRKILENRVNS